MTKDEELITRDDHDSIVGELQLMHQNLEAEHHLFICVFGAIIMHLIYNNWWLTILLPISVFIVLRKFLAKKLFDQGVKEV